MSAGVRATAGRPTRVAFACLAALLLRPATSEAHLVTTGLGPVYDGVLHLLVSPDDLVPVLAMALLAGMNGAAAGRRALFALPMGWLAGGIGGLIAGSTSLPASISPASFLLLGGLISVDCRLGRGVVATLALLVGALHGWLNGAAIAQSGLDRMGLVGIVGATFVLGALAAAFAVARRAAWTRVAVRVVGSWIAAIGLLMLGWNLRSLP